MTKGFLTKANVKQIIKYSWGVGKFSEWQYEYIGTDVIYLSYVGSQNCDCTMELRPTHVDGIVTCQLNFIREGRCYPAVDYTGEIKKSVWYRSSDISLTKEIYEYSGFSYGDLNQSGAFHEALSRVHAYV
ncbi:hypothetical protein [Clostridium transplantifaecale]|uniref:hypothetical protein n=1 Tax=Clostridium transplantifaecale TaxID=2479838 RepID=UPI000F63BAC1|nr:hypothetical protein [Clostridium transplantifaecale]